MDELFPGGSNIASEKCVACSVWKREQQTAVRLNSQQIKWIPMAAQSQGKKKSEFIHPKLSAYHLQMLRSYPAAYSKTLHVYEADSFNIYP